MCYFEGKLKKGKEQGEEENNSGQRGDGGGCVRRGPAQDAEVRCR